MKKIQISEELFRVLILYHLVGLTEYEDYIKSALADKLSKVARHEDYSKRFHS